MVVDQPDDVEAVGDNAGIREVFPNQRPVSAGQIHTDNPDAILAFELRQIAFERGFTAAAGKEMFVDTRNPGTARGGPAAVYFIRTVTGFVKTPSNETRNVMSPAPRQFAGNGPILMMSRP